jgi:hypothetical protein
MKNFWPGGVLLALWLCAILLRGALGPFICSAGFGVDHFVKAKFKPIERTAFTLPSNEEKKRIEKVFVARAR